MLFIRALDYLPDNILQYYIRGKFSAGRIEYIQLNVRYMLSSIFRKKVYHDALISNKNCYNATSKYWSSIIFSLFISAICFIPLLLYFFLVIGFTAIYSLRFPLDVIVRTRLFGMQIGDCICSDALRSEKSVGRLRYDFNLLKSIGRVIYSWSFMFIFIKISKFRMAETLFYMPETGYSNEAIRRVLIGFKSREIRLNWKSGKYEVLPGLMTGYEIMKWNYRFERTGQTDDIEKGKVILQNLVHRIETYPMMSGYDVDTNFRLDFRRASNKSAIIFLHLVSDLQYAFGVDCFRDLHDWFVFSYEELLNQGYDVYIKFHPAFFNRNFPYKADTAYLNYVVDHFGLSIEDVVNNSVSKTNIGNLNIVNHRISLPELSRVFHDFLCITHHGTVVTEAAMLGHEVICSSCSPYSYDCRDFVNLYSTKSEYRKRICDFSSRVSFESVLDKNGLYEYVYQNSLKNTNDKYMFDLMSICDVELDDSSDNWHELFINNLGLLTRTQEGRSRLDTFFQGMFNN